jgi:hypothetical protein
MSAFSPTDRFGLEPGVRLRPVPELGHCLAYTPARPALHRLNPSAWLLAELSDGSPFTEIAAEFGKAVAELGGRMDQAAVEAGLRSLMELGIVKRVEMAGTEGD